MQLFRLTRPDSLDTGSGLVVFLGFTYATDVWGADPPEEAFQVLASLTHLPLNPAPRPRPPPSRAPPSDPVAARCAVTCRCTLCPVCIYVVYESLHSNLLHLCVRYRAHVGARFVP